MSENEFLEKMVDLMDTEEKIQMDTVLENVEEWDSLSYVSFLAVCKGMGKDVAPEAILRAKTVKDLYCLLA